MGFFDAGIKESDRFAAMLIEQASCTVQAVRCLEGSLGDGPEALSRLEAFASQSAELKRVLTDELHKTFITPLDREDIFSLSRCYHDIVSYALTTLEEMHLFGVRNDPAIARMVGLLREQCEELELAIRRLPRNPRVAGDHATRVHDKEREVERVYRDAVKAVIATAGDPAHVPAVLYRREVYRHISNMSDRALDAANLFGMVVMKLA